EQLSSFRISHGAAVAIGMALDVVYSVRMGYLDAQSAERILRLLEQLGFELFAPELLASGPRLQLAVLAGAEEFREHLGGELSLTLLRGIGESFEVHELDPAEVAAAIHDLQNRRAGRRLMELMAAV
ncbi:MAG TPA: 3-dehydroquinate synthase, partial [Patescibacteria group bacterium]|nr:3-dehydroquinate synthase [Patescibacteria group bacterium]